VRVSASAVPVRQSFTRNITTPAASTGPIVAAEMSAPPPSAWYVAPAAATETVYCATLNRILNGRLP
jgi:hypothetical protein